MANERAEEVRDAIQEVIFFTRRAPLTREEEAFRSDAVRCIRKLHASEFDIPGAETAAWLQSLKTTTIQILRTPPGDEWYALARKLRQAQDELWAVSSTDSQGKSSRKLPGRRKADCDTEQREAEIYADWQRAKESGIHKSDFAKQVNLGNGKISHLAALQRLLNRAAKRNSRADK